MQKNFKKVTSLLLAFTLLFSIITSISVKQVFAENTLPALGDKLNGFTVIERGQEKIINAPTVTFKHDKTGGLVYYIASDDTNRAFDISFKTPAMDDTGLPHVFEHITISGSEKYPAQNLFFPITAQTYNTFINAMTGTTYTTYPLSSLSEDQLLALSDYYLDGVFNPMIYTEENLLSREGWRYELSDVNSPLTLTGTVYNEMRGNQNIQNATYFNMLNTLFPDSIIGNNSGGVPESIPDMTFKSITEFHSKYYHPSNSLTILYGDLDVSQFLAKLNEYFSEYEYKDVFVENGVIDPLTTPIDKSYYFPVEKNSPSKDSSIIQYAIVPSGISRTDIVGLNILSDILTHESSILTKAIKKEFPNIQLTAAINNSIAQPYIFFSSEGMNENDKTKFKSIIDDSIIQMTNKGIDKDVIDAVLAQYEFQTYMIPESNNVAVNFILNVAMNWSISGKTDYYNYYLDSLDSIKKQASKGYFENILKTHLIGNNHNALIAVIPAPGKAEENDAALNAKLAGIKSSMSEEEINNLVTESEELSKWSTEEAPKELLKDMQVLTVKNLPEEVKRYPISKNTVDGVQIMTAEAATPKIGTTYLFLDSSAISLEDLHYYYLYAQIIGSLDTKNYSKEEIATLKTRYLNAYSNSATVLNMKRGNYKPVFLSSFITLNGEYERSLEVVNEIMFSTNFNDIATIKNLVSNNKNNLRTQFNIGLYLEVLKRAYATSHEEYNYSFYLNGVDYYKFLNRLEKLIDENPSAVIAKLESIKKTLSNKENAVVLFAGNKKAISEFNGNIKNFFSEIPSEKIRNADYSSINKPSNSEAIVTDSTVQFNLLFASLDDLGIQFSGKMKVISRILYDSYLTPKIRHTIGAYDNISQFSEDGILFLSYRDPGISETYKVYEGLGDYVRNASVTQEDIDRYIISSYSAYAMPYSELNGALSNLYAELTGRNTPDERLKRMREMKLLTLENFTEFADVFDKLNEIGVKMTGGSALEIEKNIDRFKDVIYFNQIASEQ